MNHVSKFQFHFGTIDSFANWAEDMAAISNFNSTLVRLIEAMILDVLEVQ